MSSRRREDDPLGLLGTELLGRYGVEATVAHGGMSVVYQGQDTRLRRAVCIKVFHRLDPRDPAYRTTWEHFVQEAFALSQLKHPNTLRIYDFGYLEHEPRSPLHVCELLDGGTLAQLVRRDGPLAPTSVLEIIEPVIGALSEAHARGIVHRDLKPSNVLFGSAGSRRIVKLVDFGIAKALACAQAPLPHQAEDTHAAAGAGVSLYTPGWAAPEQLRGAPIGPTSDVFSLGLLVAYLLTGQTVFRSRRASDLFAECMAGDAHVAGRLAELRLDPMISHVIMRACRDVPAERYATVDEMGAALSAAVRRIELATGQPSFTASPSARSSAVGGSQPGGLGGPQPGSVGGGGPQPGSFGGGGSQPGSVGGGPQPGSVGAAAHPQSSPRIAPPPPSAPLPRSAPTALPPPSTPAPSSRLPAPGPAPAAPMLFLGGAADGEVLVAGRRLRLLAVREELDVGGQIGPLCSPARLRLTFLPDAGSSVRLHVKGLNCFVARGGDRPSSAVSLHLDSELELLSPARQRLDLLRCFFGVPGAEATMSFPLGAVTLAVPAQLHPAVILDLGPGRELALLYRAREAAADRGRR